MKPFFLIFCILGVFNFSLESKGQTKDYEGKFKRLLAQPASPQRDDSVFRLVYEIYRFYSRSPAEAALPFVLKMRNQAYESKNPFRMGQANMALAFLYSRTKQYAESFRFANLAETQWQKQANFEGLAELKGLKAYLAMGNSEEKSIIPLCKEALEMCQQHGLQHTWLNIASYLAGYYNSIGAVDSALKILRQVAKIRQPSLLRDVFTYTDLGNCFFLKNELDSARYYYFRAYDAGLKSKIKHLIFNAIGSIAQLEITLKNYKSAEKWYAQTDSLVKYEERDDLKEIYFENLSFLRYQQGKFKEGYEALYQAYSYRDSLYRKKNQTEYRDLERKYQAEKRERELKENEIKLAKEQQKRNLILVGSIVVLVFISLVAWLLLLNRKRKEMKLLSKMAESELKALRAQMNPHFMFNSLNAIQQMVLNNENKEAFRYLDTYSKLTRQILENSEKGWISVKDEIRFLELYLQMESLRFDHAFQWKIEVDESVSPHSDQIPAMLIQPLVENAIKHGLLPKEGEKKMHIRFSRPDEMGPLQVEVTDNGVGRKQAAEKVFQTDHQSMSLSITENRLKLLGGPLAGGLEVEDLIDAKGNALGTKVRFAISD